MTVIWVGCLALVLNQICRHRNPIKIQHFHQSDAQQTKRIGIYYMCISDINM